MRGVLIDPIRPGKATSKLAMKLLVLVILVAGFASTLQAIRTPFWFDEICTVTVARMPGLSGIWRALEGAADTNPPLYYYLLQFSRNFIADDHLAYRLPSILGFLVSIFCTYKFLSRGVGAFAGIIGSTFLLLTPMRYYAHEARPYALMIGCVSVAIVAWQRSADSPLNWVLVAISLAATVSLHYYSVFVWPVFVVAEASVVLLERRIRKTMWLAFILGAMPLLLWWKLLIGLHEYYGRHFWANLGIIGSFATFDWLFDFGHHDGFFFSITLATLFAVWKFVPWRDQVRQGIEDLQPNPVPFRDWVLALMLLWVPFVALTLAEIAHLGLSQRYMLPAVIGGALIVGALSSVRHRLIRSSALVLGILGVGLTIAPAVQLLGGGSLLDQRREAASELSRLVPRGQHSLPIVISSGIRYLRMAYYIQGDPRLYSIVDPPIALKVNGSDTVDLTLLVLRHYFPLQVVEYGVFTSRYREFLLVSGDDDFVSGDNNSYSWALTRFAAEAQNIRLVQSLENIRVYRVTLAP